MGYGVWGMKMTFEIPDEIGERLKASVPKGQRSPLVAQWIAKEIAGAEAALEQQAHKANALKLDLSDWEKLNESETW